MIGACYNEKASLSKAVSLLWALLGVWLSYSLANTVLEVWEDDEGLRYVNGTAVGHHRSKRFLYMNSERRLNLPPGTGFSAESTWDFPGFNPLPDGYTSETAISVPFDVSFDDLGLTTDENEFGYFPFLNPIFWWLGNATNVTNYANIFGPGHAKNNEDQRSVILQVAENALDNLGINGRACVLRTICEIHDQSLFGHGLVGEFIELIVTLGDVAYDAPLLGDYSSTEKQGRSGKGCYRYKKKCPLSLFAPLTRLEKHKEDKIREDFFSDGYQKDYDKQLKRTEVKHRGKYVKKKKKYGFKKLSRRKYVRELREGNDTSIRHSRRKRFIYFGPAGRLRLPIGSLYIIKPQLSLPFATNLPDGYTSALSVGIPIRILFDDLGLTSTLNPFMSLPFSFRRKRDTWKPIPGVNYDGGDREYVYIVIEHMLNTWSLDGIGCLQRAICENHLSPLKGYGLLGDMLHVFLSPSRAIHAEIRLQDYLEAEEFGQTYRHCHRYIPLCPYSLFTTEEELSQRYSARFNTYTEMDS